MNPWRVLPYVGAFVVGISWDWLHPVLAFTTLAICVYLIYFDSKD